MPQLNRVSEWKNQILLDMVRSMMSVTNLFLFFWRHSLLIANYLLNRVLSKFISITPYKMWHSKKLSLDHIKIWRCPAHIQILQVGKLEVRSIKAHFIGYLKESLGYYFYFSEDHNVIVSRHPIFLEK